MSFSGRVDFSTLREESVKAKNGHDCIERRQLNFIQCVGGISYWEDDPAE